MTICVGFFLRCEIVVSLSGTWGKPSFFTPPSGSIPAKRFMVIGLGEEQDLSLDSLRVVGRIAAREAESHLNAKHVAWAPCHS